MLSNSTSTEPVDGLSLVSSLYGPGNILSWLCTLISVFLTWCFNLQSRRKDNFSIDTIFVLAVPAVATGHCISILFFPEDFPGENVTADRQQLFTSQLPTTMRHAAALEAPLTVCETFAGAAVPLTFIALLNGNMKRAFSVLFVGLSAFSVEAVIFIQTRGIDVQASNLSRPFLFNFFHIMIAIVSFLIIWSSVFIFLLAIVHTRRKKHLEEAEPKPTPIDLDLKDWKTVSWASLKLELPKHGSDTGRETQCHDEDESIRVFTLVCVVFLPLSFGTSVFGALGHFGITKFMMQQARTFRFSVFIPRSSTAITELDQVVAITLAAIALSMSLWEAVKSYPGLRKSRNDSGFEDMTTWKARVISLQLRYLRLVRDELDKTRDDVKIQELVESRDELCGSIGEVLSLSTNDVGPCLRR